ncbi:MAG TPA: CARDB domain-containing protein [Gemmatimonadales bacterium]
MVAVRTLTRAVIVVLIGAGTAVWYACGDRAAESPTGPAAAPPLSARRPDLRGVIAAQRRHTDALLRIPGVVGTAVIVLPDGRPSVQILLERDGAAGLPQALDGVPVTLRVTGRLMAFSDPIQRQRPAPLGFSVGHPAVTAGTIGARVRDALGRVYILSNNHVLANSNDASIGDPQYQPGPFDGGTAADEIATLTEFQAITFTSTANNIMDAGVALSSTDLLDNATPSDDGYGMPNATIYGDADGDGLFDDRNALLGLNVQKYGRTTRLTHGQITGVNATVTVCYAVVGPSCTKSARFVDQLIISPGTFSGGGDSGSLIVTDDGNLNPVALLFAGSSTVTIGNRIDLVLNRFGVAIDGFAPPPPGPLTDLAVTSLSGPSAVVQGTTAGITVMVKNVGNQDVSTFDVTLQDTTEHVTVGTQSVPGLAASASTTLTFSWTPTATGDHNLMASHTLVDDKATNDQRAVTIPVNPPVTDLAVTSMSAPGSVIVGHVTDIVVTVANLGNQNVASSFDVILQDATAGVTLGTQIVTGLAAGAGTTLIFSWNTTSAALGGHTLVATHSLTDDNAANNQRSAVVTVNPKPIDIALTGITGPPSVFQGDTAHIVVTVKNVGEVDVGTSFDVVLTDGTAGGVTVGTQTVAGLAAGATTTVDIPWNTAGAATNTHILFATQKLPDDVSTNNSIAIAINVKPPVAPPSADVAVTSMNTPGSVTQGSTAAIGVTIQNVGGQNVTTSFDVVLTDATAGVMLGTQTVTGLAAGAGTTLTFSWNTTTAALGGHTLVATHSLTDDNAANNQRSAVVTVNPKPIDIALTGITGPPSVFQGDTAHIVVTVKNVGEVDVGTSFDVVLADGTAGGVTVGTQTVPGLAIGATTTVDFPWNTAGAATNTHILIATQKLPDDVSTNNSIAIATNVNPPVAPPSTDVAVTGVNGPAAVTQGSTAAIGVTVQNVGGQNVSTSFDVVLTDATAGVTLGTQTVSGLTVGASATRTFSWNTTSAALGGHTLVATHSLTDDNAANNQGSAAVTVNPPVTDVAVTGVNGPASVTQGSTASIGVTVQNVGGQGVSTNFDVVLTDATAGVTLGTQTVSGLTVGASATRTFSWNTTNTALGGHTLVATHSLTDDNAANNQRSTAVTVTPQPTDLALASITAPAQVTQGDTAPVVVTVQNVGGQDVTTSFDVVLTDGTAGGVTVGTQAIPGLAVGASATRTFNWNTAGAALNAHILIATQKLADNNSTNNARAIAITVNPPSVHVGNLGGVAGNSGNTWSATVVITVHDTRHTPLNGVTVRGSWNGSSSDVGECSTSEAGGTGTCSVVLSSIPNSTKMVSFAVTAMTLAGYVYKPSANHDPDGSSNGFSIVVKR